MIKDISMFGKDTALAQGRRGCFSIYFYLGLFLALPISAVPHDCLVHARQKRVAKEVWVLTVLTLLSPRYLS